jgi:hypothetical protein
MFYVNFSKETFGHVPNLCWFCPLKMIIASWGNYRWATFRKLPNHADGRAASVYCACCGGGGLGQIGVY